MIPLTIFHCLLFLFVLFICSIIASVVYNLYIHPYSKYPGPFFARTSSFYSLWHAYAGDLHLDVTKCHEKYGPFVRYGPNRLIVNTTSGFKAIYGQGRNFQKSNGYAPHPYFPTVSNTHNTIDKATHGRKRRIVSQGFSESVLAASEQYILDHVNKLCDSLVESTTAESKGWSPPRDMAMWTNYFTLDVISDLTFGRAFELTTKPELRWLIEAIVAGNRHIYMRFACPWLFNLPFGMLLSPAQWLFPNMANEKHQFKTLSDKYTTERMTLLKEGKLNRKDVMSALLEARDPKSGEKLSEEETWCEAHLMIAAGGDTTSTALAAVLFYLSRDPSRHTKLVAEIRSTFTEVSQIKRGKQLSSCHYLRACIDEALRLAPAAPGVLWRQACEGGAFVDGEYIPAGLDIGTCTYALSHTENHFEHPYDFKPERFMAKHNVGDKLKEYPNTAGTTVSADPVSTATKTLPHRRVDNMDAYAPFSIGPRSCLAKPLAYLELSLALAHIIWLLDFEVADATGEGGPSLGKGRERRGEFQITDMFSSNKEGPVLRFRRAFWAGE